MLPGSKSVQADLSWLREQGWEAEIARHLRYGGKLLGICGGYQMLGRRLHDRLGVEGAPGSMAGLGHLEVETELAREKCLSSVDGELLVGGGARMQGYEIHMGVTRGPDTARALLRFDDGRLDGAVSTDGQVAACYAHGLLDSPAALSALLGWAGAGRSQASTLPRAARRTSSDSPMRWRTRCGSTSWRSGFRALRRRVPRQSPRHSISALDRPVWPLYHFPPWTPKSANLSNRSNKLVSLFEAEKSENRALRTRVAELESANRRLEAKVDNAAARIDEVLEQLPQVS